MCICVITGNDDSFETCTNFIHGVVDVQFKEPIHPFCLSAWPCSAINMHEKAMLSVAVLVDTQ